MPIRLGIVGMGGMGNAHAQNFSQIKGVELTSCLDLIPNRMESAQTKYGFKYQAKDLDQLIDQVDAVCVVTPDACHAPMTLKVLAAGKDVLCEKPLTRTLAEAKEVAAAAEKAAKRGQIHMIDFSYRRSAAVGRAIELAQEGAIGALRHVYVCYLQSWLSCRPAWGPTDTWASSYLLWKLSTSEGSGGVLGDLGSHLLDLASACTEDLTAIRCHLATFPKVTPDGLEVTSHEGKQLDANDTAIMDLQFVSGAVGLAHTSRWATGCTNTVQLQVHGTEGAFRINLDQSYEAIELCLGEARHRQTWDRIYLPAAPSMFQRFISAIETRTPTVPDLLRGAKIQGCLAAAERSAKSGAWENTAVD